MNLASMVSSQKHYKNMTGVKHPRRPPCRTIAEFAEEFGVTHGQLVACIKNAFGPKPAVKHGKGWYVVADMRKWWAESGKAYRAAQ